MARFDNVTIGLPSPLYDVDCVCPSVPLEATLYGERGEGGCKRSRFRCRTRGDYENISKVYDILLSKIGSYTPFVRASATGGS